MYVKNEYKKVRDGGKLTHAETMKKLGSEWKKQKEDQA